MFYLAQSKSIYFYSETGVVEVNILNKTSVFEKENNQVLLMGNLNKDKVIEFYIDWKEISEDKLP